jgi:D-amino peptidase
MKIYVSADIEGVAGISCWDEANPAKAEWGPVREQMTREVAAACEGALEAGATQILVKDAHASGRNLILDRLPREARVVRGWSGHPLMMVQELDPTFDALMMIGYHSRAGSGGNPLAHTYSSSQLALIEVNGSPVAEFHLNAWAAALHGVPVVLVSGDEALCEEVRAFHPPIRTVTTMRGVGASSVAVHPDAAVERIRAGSKEAVGGDLAACAIPLPGRFEVRIRYKEASRAYRTSFFPGVRALDDVTNAFDSDDWFEVMRALQFITYG